MDDAAAPIRMPPLAYATTIRALGIDWPLPITVISDRDRNRPLMAV
jgi:hypothetical protein